MTSWRIQLPNGEWEFDDTAPLGKPGGFGQVFRGWGEVGDVAVKRLNLSAAQASHRELNIGEQLMQRDLTHVVPVIDVGQDADSDRYFLVMPICDCSLQEKIDNAEGLGKIDFLKEVITSIIIGLQEVDDITHRDLKPANILRHQGKWKVADFGIAKFVEDSTSHHTLRTALTPEYAAPEQWRGERPTSATDTYALGCIIHTLMNGHPPFSGSIDDIREQHLFVAPAPLGKLPPRVAALVSHMLRKPQAARPTLALCSKVFSAIELEEERGVPAVLADAAKQVSEHEARAEAERRSAQSRRDERNALFEDTKQGLISTFERICSFVQEEAESASVDRRRHLVFGHAELEWSEPERLNEAIPEGQARGKRPFGVSNWDVLGYSAIRVNCAVGWRGGPYRWSATLLFADRKDGDSFRWYEVAFRSWGETVRDEPFALAGYEAHVDLALGNVPHTVGIAYGPYAIDWSSPGFADS
jgi:serine/threonine-protein kinase